MARRDFLMTIFTSVIVTLVVDRLADSLLSTAVADHQDRLVELDVDRLIVRRELIVSDTGKAWEEGFEAQEIPRGAVIRSLSDPNSEQQTVAGIWVRSRLIKSEIDDPFDDRFHAIERDGTPFRAPGHISWNIWLNDAWRQLAIIQGEGLEDNETPYAELDGDNHPGRLRFQSFRPHHEEPLTDATLGQGRMSIGGGGFGGGGLPYASEVLQLWGGTIETFDVETPAAPRVVSVDGSQFHTYALIALGPQGSRSEVSAIVEANGRATLEWDSARGADSYIIVRDGEELTEPLRIEGSQKQWTDSQ